MTALVLNSTLNCVGKFDNLYTDNEIKNEPMLFSCGITHAMNFGGKITQIPVENKGWQCEKGQYDK